MIDLGDFDFPLPEALIAKYPASRRDDARLLFIGRHGEEKKHLLFHELGTLLRPGDVLVLNKTKVIKARVYGTSATERRFEILLLSPTSLPNRWTCLVRPGRHVEPGGSRLRLLDSWEGFVQRNIQLSDENDSFQIQFPPVSQKEFFAWLDRNGAVPLPPYLKRPAEPSDEQRYQTVFATEPGSVAAPTAGLHFTSDLIESLQRQGIQFESLHLHIGYGTFAPLPPQATQLHPEHFHIDVETNQRLHEARARGNRVIAVGTTSLRALESAANGLLSGETRLFIRPGYLFTQVDGLITNFHLPRSSLFVLLCAFLGREKSQSAYREAIEKNYRFFSYGDAMALL